MSEPHACPFRLGGTGDVKPADEHIQGLVDQLSDDIQAKSDGKDYSGLKAVSFKSQIVAGYNHFVKAMTKAGNHIHLRIHVPHPHANGGKPVLHGIQHDKSAHDEIDHF